MDRRIEMKEIESDSRNKRFDSDRRKKGDMVKELWLIEKDNIFKYVILNYSFYMLYLCRVYHNMK